MALDDNVRCLLQDESLLILVILLLGYSELRHWLEGDQQANKMADCWCVENLWGILTQRVKERQPTAADLYTIIVEEWIKIDQDKELIKKMMKSMPKRFDAVRRLGGRQITKADYEHE